MAAPVLVGALKKLAVYIVTDKKLFKKVCGIVIGIIVILLMPLIAIFSIASGDISFDTDYLQSALAENITSEDNAKLQEIENDMNLIQTKMTEKSLDDKAVKKAQVLYTLALYDYSDREGFVDDLVGCFEGTFNDEQLISNINLKFGTNILYADFIKVIQSIETDNSSDENSG